MCILCTLVTDWIAYLWFRWCVKKRYCLRNFVFHKSKTQIQPTYIYIYSFMPSFHFALQSCVRLAKTQCLHSFVCVPSFGCFSRCPFDERPDILVKYSDTKYTRLMRSSWHFMCATRCPITYQLLASTQNLRSIYAEYCFYEGDESYKTYSIDITVF